MGNISSFYIFVYSGRCLNIMQKNLQIVECSIFQDKISVNPSKIYKVFCLFFKKKKENCSILIDYNLNNVPLLVPEVIQIEFYVRKTRDLDNTGETK